MTATDSRSDLEIIDAINRGDDDAFAVLYHRHREWVHRLAWRFTQNQEDTLDVLQETFAYLARKFPGLTLTASMTTFLYPVVKNTAIVVRKRKRREPTLSPDTLPDRPFPEAAHPTHDLQILLRNLSDEHQEVVNLRFVDDLSLEEIATLLKIPLGTVKSRLHHALAELRQNPRIQKYYENI